MRRAAPAPAWLPGDRPPLAGAAARLPSQCSNRSLTHRNLGLQRGKVFGAFETSKRVDPFDEGGFDLLRADKFKFRIRRGARRLKRRHVLGVAGDLARQDFNLSFEFRANGKGQPVAECVLSSALLSAIGTRPGAFFRIAPVCRNLPFAKPACRQRTKRL